MNFKAFTLIELLITIVIVSAGLIGIMALFENATKGSLKADLNVISTNLAHEKLEGIVLDKVRDGYAALSGVSYPDETFTGDYSVFTRQTAIAEVAGSDFLTAEAGSGYKRVDVTVKWGPQAPDKITVSTVLSNY